MVTDPVEGVLAVQLGRFAGVRCVYLTPDPDGVGTVYVQLDQLAEHLSAPDAAALEEALYDEMVRVIRDQRRAMAWCGAGTLAPEPDTGARPLYLPRAAAA